MGDGTPLWEEVAPHVEALLNFAARDLLTQRDREYPNEAVGILTAGGIVYPLINQARSPKRFEVSKTLVQEGISELVKWGEHPVATYHSHPTSASGPSDRDCLYMRETEGGLHIIIGMDGIAAWLWKDGLRSVAKVPLPERVKADGEHTGSV